MTTHREPNRYALTITWTVLAVGLGLSMWVMPAWAQSGPSPTAASPPTPRVALEKGISIGAAGQFANLAVFPVYSAAQRHIGEFTTLQDALERNQAVVRERGVEGQVSRVAVENRSRRPILVLAGTIIKGGKQDRQIGHDVLIEARTTVDVEAFCVEQGRWAPTRKGVATGGRFKAHDTLAHRSVRGAGQFRANQGEVWAEVAKVNRDSRKSAATGTLLATLDDAELAAEKKKLNARVHAFLSSHPERQQIVGVAYAVDGKVRGVRWFMNHKLFELYGPAFISTAAMEAVIARKATQAAGRPVVVVKVQPAAVARFVAERKKAKRKVKKRTAGGNENEYLFSDDGYGSEVMIKPSPKAAPVRFSAEFL